MQPEKSVNQDQPANQSGSLAAAVPYQFAKKHRCTLNENGDICFQRGASLIAISELARQANPNHPYIEYSETDFNELLQETYEKRSQQTDLISEDLDELDLGHLAETLTESEDLLNQDNNAPVVRLINVLLHQAIQKNASDVHLEVYETNMVVRFRIDGVLQDILEPRRALAPVLISRLKVMAKLDIAEKRLPQDGRIALTLGQSRIDVRVSTMPSSHGERVVLRLLYKTADSFDNQTLGMSEQCLQLFKQALSNPHGIVLVTGPTGSGKSTSLYAGLCSIRDGKKNILTVEDPVEYDLEGVGQTQVNLGTGMTFAKGLRAILRQDPDVVMVGEIRDAETAEIAIQASLTGHLVLSTLHTNSAAGAISRLTDMGVEPFLLSSSLSALVAQRLIRLLCPHCKQSWQADKAAADILDIEVGHTLHEPQGCDQCNQQGYSGRSGIYEIIPIDKPIQTLIHSRAAESEIVTQARLRTSSLFEDGKRRVLEGETSIEELLRVTGDLH